MTNEDRRCIVLNASYEFIHVTRRWYDSVCLVLKGKARALATYEEPIRSERQEILVPAVAVLTSQVNVGRRRSIFSIASKRNVLVRDNFACAYCGKHLSMKSATKEHVHPRSRGGKDTLENVVAACTDCNGRKADRTPEEAGMKLLLQPRALTEDEKMSIVVKTHRASERGVWLRCLKEEGITLF